jgi:mRNA-degrading endonuclease RelE of RelBE toxin-antitoxin system
MRIDLHPRFRKSIAKLSSADRNRVANSLSSLLNGFGLPHLHSGRGIRRLHKNLFECRAGLHWRIVFFAQKGLLTAYDLMTQNPLQSWLKSF